MAAQDVAQAGAVLDAAADAATTARAAARAADETFAAAVTGYNQAIKPAGAET